jgi:PAS domain S-box-containing protein
MKKQRLRAGEPKADEQIMQSIINSSVIPTFVINRDHRVICWNGALAEISKIPAEKVLGTDQHWRAFYSSRRPCMADLIIDEKFEEISNWYTGKGSKSGLIEDAYEATDFFPELGEEGKWLRFTAAAIRDPMGNLIGAVETLEDITDRRRIEEALQVSETRFRRLFESAKDGILILDGGTGQITEVNLFLMDMLGYSREELLGKRLWEIGVFKDIEKSKAAFLELQSKEYIRYENLPLETRNGRIINVEFVSNVYRVNHTKVIQCNIRDITERRRAEEEREKLILQLQEAISKIKILSGLLPICASCKKIRNDQGYWEQIESFIRDHSEAEFSHSLCPECITVLYPEYVKRKK